MLGQVVEYLAESMRSYTLPPGELRYLQKRKLSRSLQWAYGYVPLYHSWFKKLGKHPDDISNLKDLTLLPTMSRADILATYTKV